MGVFLHLAVVGSVDVHHDVHAGHPPHPGCGLSGAYSRRREFRDFADAPSPSLLTRLIKGEEGAAE